MSDMLTFALSLFSGAVQILTASPMLYFLGFILFAIVCNVFISFINASSDAFGKK